MCLHISAHPKCSDGCIGDLCDQLNGWCIKTCNSDRSGPFCCPSGFFGRYCNSMCPSNCAICTTSLSCYVCKNGFYGEQCTKCPYQCYQCSTNYSCSVCVKGYFGTTCTKQCSPGCILNHCRKVTGECFSGCSGNYIGSHCSECMRGYYGVGCAETCSPGCVDGVCWTNGMCKLGCKSDKYIGDKCSIKDDNNCTACGNTESEIGNLLLCSISIALICILKLCC